MTYSLETEVLVEAAKYAPRTVTLTLLPGGVQVRHRDGASIFGEERTEIVSYERMVYSVGNPLIWAIDKVTGKEPEFKPLPAG